MSDLTMIDGMWTKNYGPLTNVWTAFLVCTCRDICNSLYYNRTNMAGLYSAELQL